MLSLLAQHRNDMTASFPASDQLVLKEDDNVKLALTLPSYLNPPAV